MVVVYKIDPELHTDSTTVVVVVLLLCVLQHYNSSSTVRTVRQFISTNY